MGESGSAGRAVSPAQIGATKAVLFGLCLVPLALLIQGGVAGTLGANPVETIQRATGDWGFRLLLATLAVTPLRKYSGWHWLVRLRRMLGLFAFFYVCLHLTTYVWLDNLLDIDVILRDVLKRPFVSAGFAAFALMVPLAATSSHAMVRRLGGRRWQALHRSIYAIAIFVLAHRWWMAKEAYLEPMVYTAIVAWLLGIRAWWREQERQRQVDGAYGFDLKRRREG